jgi:hypothetical protein
MGAWGGWLQE